MVSFLFCFFSYYKHKLFLTTYVCAFFLGIDDGSNLAAPGIVWDVYGTSWEVLFTGSVAWKRGGERQNKRSHKLKLSGPHFVFVRRSEHVGTPIAWDKIRKFHSQLFFLHGTPAREVSKANMHKAAKEVNNFLGDVRNPRIWSDVKLVRESKTKAKVPIDCTADEQPVQEAAHTAKRSSLRLRRNTKKGVWVCVWVILFYVHVPSEHNPPPSPPHIHTADVCPI